MLKFERRDGGLTWAVTATTTVIQCSGYDLFLFIFDSKKMMLSFIDYLFLSIVVFFFFFSTALNY